MNYSVSKRALNDDFQFMFFEDLYEKFISKETIKEIFESGFAFYNFQELELQIIETFGKPKLEKCSYIYQFGDINKTDFNEKAYIYENFIIFIKNKFFRDYSFNYDDLSLELIKNYNTENESKKLQQISINILSDGSTPKLKENFESLMSKTPTDKRKESELSILCYNQIDGFHLKNVKTIKTSIDIDLNYNEDFTEVSNYIIERLNTKNDKGLVLLHGLPGTGKTSYIRHLTKEIKDKPIIYIPPDFASNISNPDFITFFLDYANSILIIEDAENILRSRKAGGNQSVANLLSVSDGLLGDGLKLQILCTFNANINEIDEALLREGRLIAEYKFEKLSIEKSQKLLNKVLEDSTDIPVIDKEMTLAEIFNYKDKNKRFVAKKQAAIGFTNRK
jgi:SpoVK/Ycf46/Vps4 family AAA+-type ATPase